MAHADRDHSLAEVGWWDNRGEKGRVMTSRAARTPFPNQTDCAACGDTIEQPYGYCSNCDAFYCATCAAGHYCTPSCAANGCFAGLCVRVVRDGKLGPWASAGTDGPLT